MNPFRIAGILTKVGFKTTVGLVKGTIHTACDCYKFVNHVTNKDADGACEILDQRLSKTVRAADTVLKSTCDLLDTAVDQKKKFWTDNNVEKAATLATLGIITAVGVDSVVDTDDAVDHSALTDLQPNVPSDALLASSFGLDSDAIHNGLFVGDRDDLNDLIKAGELSDTHHLNVDEYTRDIGLRDAFLTAHGWNDLPEGYEVHHIVPLCEGGPDTLGNMILISEADHDVITAAHRTYYRW